MSTSPLACPHGVLLCPLTLQSASTSVDSRGQVVLRPAEQIKTPWRMQKSRFQSTHPREHETDQHTQMFVDINHNIIIFNYNLRVLLHIRRNNEKLLPISQKARATHQTWTSAQRPGDIVSTWKSQETPSGTPSTSAPTTP